MQKFMRKWQVIDKVVSDNIFTVMSYNILAQSNTSNHFNSHSNSIMDKNNRNNLIKEKILRVKPDVCLLQEMDSPNLDQFLLFFENYGMSTFFQKKSDDKKFDGTFIGFNQNKFEYLSYQYFDCFFQNHYNYDQQDLLEQEMWYPTNVQFLLLKHKNTQKNLLFINSHLPYNRRKGHVKLAIIYIVYMIIDQIKQQQDLESVIWGGDFNTIPYSMLYNLLTKGDLNLQANLAEYSNLLYSQKLKEQNFTLKQISEFCNKQWTKPLNIYDDQSFINFDFLKLLVSLKLDISNEQITFKNNRDFQQDLTNENIESILQKTFKQNTFSSTYSKLKKQIELKKDSNQDILFSHYTSKFIAPVDYLLFKEGNLKVTEILLAPSIKYLNKLEHSLPCKTFGSDHICLAAKYKLNQLIQSFINPYWSSS